MSKARGTLLVKGTDGLPLSSEPVRLVPCARKEKSVDVSHLDVLAVCYTAADGTDYWVTNESNAAEVTRHQAITPTVIADKDWSTFRQRFMNYSRSAPSLSLIKLLAAAGVPFCGEKVRQLILDDCNHWRAALADMVYERDMSAYQALVLIHREKGDKAAVEVPRWIPHLHLKKTWFAFTNIDDAMSVKFSFPKSTLIEL